MFAPAEALTAGFFDRLVPVADLETAAEQAAEALTRINLPAHFATKLRARGQAFKTIRALIDADITLEDAERRIAERNVPA